MTAAKMANGYRAARQFERSHPHLGSLALEVRYSEQVHALNRLVDADYAVAEAIGKQLADRSPQRAAS